MHGLYGYMGTCHMGTLEKNVNKRVNCAMIFFARSSGRVTTHHATFPMRQEGILVLYILDLSLATIHQKPNGGNKRTTHLAGCPNKFWFSKNPFSKDVILRH